MPKKLTPEQVEELVLDWKDGWTVNEVSVIYRISERTVYRYLAESGAKRRHRPRKSRKRAVSKPRKELQPCGTNAAYQRHRRAREYPCSPCLEAHAQNVAEAKRKKQSNGLDSQ